MFVEEHALTNTSACSWWRVKVPIAHYLERRTFGCHARHVLCNTNTLVILLVLPAKKRKTCVNFHHSIRKMFYM
jgi:hypothetical protein